MVLVIFIIQVRSKLINLNLVVDDYGVQTTKEDDDFDMTVGALEKIVFDNRFIDLQTSFLNKYCGMLQTFHL